MIFVTVGTHEQPFNRLIQKIDELKKDGIINEDVIIQTGFSTYEPKYCQWSKLIPYQQMVKNVADARIVITHGGPASFIMPLQIGKTPIVVPRQHQFNEHVNDHQVEFARNVAQRMGTIIPVEDINTLGDIITNYEAQLSDSDSLVTTTQIAKEYGCGAKVFNRLLHLHGIQYRANGQWVLYSEHHGKGYTSSLTFRLQRSDGSEVEKLHGGKGRMALPSLQWRYRGGQAHGSFHELWSGLQKCLA